MAKTLLVCVPGLRLGRKHWDGMLGLLQKEPELQNSDLFWWDHRCGYLSTRYAESLAASLAAAIDGEWERAKHAGTTYDNIILMGHSLGATIVRQAYLAGLGSYVKNLPAKDWAAKVSRIVLFAGINRGLFPPEEAGVQRAPYRMRRWLGRHLIELASQVPMLHFLGEDILAGSDFVTNLRLWWIRKLDSMKEPPTVVQLVGTDDAIVRSSDSLDVEQDRAGSQLNIDGADHGSIIKVHDATGKMLEGRYALIRKAVLDPFPHTPSPVPLEEQVKPVVFVVHGIRASNGTWVEEASRKIQSTLQNAQIVKATYWYFSALDFAIPILRKRKIRWFKDTYSYYLARSPRVPFHFLGHSNGTYLLGHSLQRLSGMQFERIVLAGSVLPRNFDWQVMLDRRQAATIWNHRASLDIPVAILCNALRGLRMRDVGTGGFEGFTADTRIHECHYHPGGHSAALEEAPLSVLANQAAGLATDCPGESLGPSPGWFGRLSAISRLLPYAALISILAISYWLGGVLGPHIHYGMLTSRLVVGALLLLISGLLLEFL